MSLDWLHPTLETTLLDLPPFRFIESWIKVQLPTFTPIVAYGFFPSVRQFLIHPLCAVLQPLWPRARTLLPVHVWEMQ
jgi:hypothetical protein